MPSVSIRKRVYGLIRTTFSSASPVVGSTDCEENSLVRSRNSLQNYSNNTFIMQCISSGQATKRNEIEIYSGKTGSDLPVLYICPLSKRVRSAYTGPDGGLTEVDGVRRQQLITMVNLDDELSLSFDGECLDDCEEHSMEMRSVLVQSASCTSLTGDLSHSDVKAESHNFCGSYDWESFDRDRCCGKSASLYERNPLTGVNAGNPVADVFGIIARDNNVIMGLADGVNWGEGARLAARCAIRGAIDHLNHELFNKDCRTTNDVFHSLLGAFHSAHTLILQEGGELTTLCVAVVTQLKNSDTWVLCVCNVGDSLCFVYNPVYGVSEVTVASHDINQMRDMRDAGGALGPVDGTNPQLQNLTCSMTFVEPDDIVFITSDGVSDNFDPIVGKFCVVKRGNDFEEKSYDASKPITVSTRASDSGQDSEFIRTRTCNAFLPCVDAEQRHELMLMRMSDIISNGILPPSTRSRPSSFIRTSDIPDVSASQLCDNLIQFAVQLSSAKRRTLEDPTLYASDKRLTKSELKNRRRMVRYRLSELPGKLDHATVVAFKVGLWSDACEADSKIAEGKMGSDHANKPIWTRRCRCSTDGTLNREKMLDITHSIEFYRMNDCSSVAKIFLDDKTVLMEAVTLNVKSDYSDQLVVNTRNEGSKEKNNAADFDVKLLAENGRFSARKHVRGSIGRHTLSVDVAWLKRFVTTCNSSSGNVKEKTNRRFRSSMILENSSGLGHRLRSLIG